MAISPNILVIDDDEIMRDSCRQVLSRDECSVKLAENGYKGLELMKKEFFDIVILDLKMPGLSGMEVLKGIKSDDPETIVIVITGYATVESAVEAIKKGAYDYIPKPFKMEELEVIVSRALERHTLLRQLGVFRGLTLALIISVPFWLILGIILALVWK